jgi:bifunctional N-acetylglucosamine-1-phosphate-uridyltransferase/glucosamine-1-phosphate-acetyltransferase GlmU-like protein
MVKIFDFVDCSDNRELGALIPWDFPASLATFISSLLKNISSADFLIRDQIAIHKSASVEVGAIIKGAAIVGENCFVASSALLRGGVILSRDVIIGPGVEVKTSFFGVGSKAAHLNFVGDSVVGHRVNIEAGAMLANYRNEFEKSEIHCNINGRIIQTGVEKFGSLVGDDSKIGANAVLAPGTLLPPKTIIRRLQLVDQTLGNDSR